MIEVTPNLFVGEQNDYDHDVAHRDGWAVVHACKEPHHRNALGYTGRGAPQDHPEYLVARRGNRLMLNIVDADIPAFFDKTMIDAALDFIDEALESGEPDDAKAARLRDRRGRWRRRRGAPAGGRRRNPPATPRAGR
jgi:hypothetical protein